MRAHLDRIDPVAERITKRETSILAVLAPPWIIAAVTFPVGVITRAVWKDQPWPIVGLAAATVALTALVAFVSHSRGPVARVHVIATPAAIGGWLLLATITGVVDGGRFVQPTCNLWLLLAVTGAISWNIRSHVRADHGRSLWDELTHTSGIGGVRMKPQQANEHRVKARLRLPAGTTVDEVQRATGTLAASLSASGVRVPPNGVRVAPDPEDAAAGTLTIVRRDMLRAVNDLELVIPGGPPTRSIADPFHAGVYEDAEPAAVRFCRPGYGVVHYLLQGMPGAGKTAFVLSLLGQAFLCNDVLILALDVKKAAQTFKDVRHGLDMLLTTEAQGRRLFKLLRQRVVPILVRLLAERGLDKWEPGCGLPALWLLFEEAGGVATDDDDFVSLTETFRSVGIVITTSLQRATYGRIDTDARANLPGAVCFGVDDVDDARLVLPDRMVDAGADPSIWEASRPGCAFLYDPSIDDLERLTTPLRGPRVDMNLPKFQAMLRAAADYHVRYRPSLHPEVADALAELWPASAPVAVATVDNGFHFPQASNQEITDEMDSEDVEVTEEDMGIDPYADDPHPTYQPGIDDDMPESPSNWRFGPEQGPIDADEVRRILAAQIMAVRAAGRDVMTIDDVRPLFAERKIRSRPWFYAQLRAWVDEGLLMRVDEGWAVGAFNLDEAEKLAVPA